VKVYNARSMANDNWNVQENFQQATRRRQTRIWRNEQELYFLQHTNAADLERVRAFQQQHAARLIQRAWRSTTQSVSTLKGKKAEIRDPSARVFTFDPSRPGRQGGFTASSVTFSEQGGTSPGQTSGCNCRR
jgi:nuclear transport factor 2 (NTF2) superfamily protein